MTSHPRHTSGLVPYCGHRVERRARVGQAWVDTAQDTDVSGETRYEFNSLGYRGPEFRRDADLTVFVFGESDAFGLGLGFEDAWPSHVVRRIARERGVAEERVCYMNFAECGVSNSYIARTVLSQCHAVRPDLVLVNFAGPARTEGYADGETFPIGEWHRLGSRRRDLFHWPEDKALRSRLEDQLRRGNAFLDFTSMGQGRIESTRNMLLVQYCLASLGVVAVAAMRNVRRYRSPEFLADPAIGPLMEQIDSRFLADVAIDDERFASDGSHDDNHFGRQTHHAFGQAMYEFLRATHP